MILHVIAAHNNNVTRGADLVPKEVHIGRYSRFLMTILEGSGMEGHQREKRDHLDYLGLMRDRQDLVRAYNLVRKKDRLTNAKHQAANYDIEKILTTKQGSK